jgi:hypothetical protein
VRVKPAPRHSVSATDCGPTGWDADYGWGRIDAAETLSTYVFADGFESGTMDAWSMKVP